MKERIAEGRHAERPSQGVKAAQRLWAHQNIEASPVKIDEENDQGVAAEFLIEFFRWIGAQAIVKGEIAQIDERQHEGKIQKPFGRFRHILDIQYTSCRVYLITGMTKEFL